MGYVIPQFVLHKFLLRTMIIGGVVMDRGMSILTISILFLSLTACFQDDSKREEASAGSNETDVDETGDPYRALTRIQTDIALALEEYRLARKELERIEKKGRSEVGYLKFVVVENREDRSAPLYKNPNFDSEQTPEEKFENGKILGILEKDGQYYLVEWKKTLSLWIHSKHTRPISLAQHWLETRKHPRELIQSPITRKNLDELFHTLKGGIERVRDALSIASRIIESGLTILKELWRNTDISFVSFAINVSAQDPSVELQFNVEVAQADSE